MYTKTQNIIRTARKHLANESARVCLADAISLFEDGKYELAYRRALSSIRYSVGIFHADYKAFC